MIVIEMNPRVSRSSALASKATGFPIAKAAAKLAVGYTLDEIVNDITKATPACFEPSIDYCVVKVPRFAFEKFQATDDTLSTRMKAVGEVMAIGRTFEESLGKAMRSLENGRAGLGADGKGGEADASDEALEDLVARPTAERIFYLAEALRRGWTVERASAASRVDPFFVARMADIVRVQENLRGMALDELDADAFRLLKRMGLADAQIAHLTGSDELTVRTCRKMLGVRPAFKTVDTCAAEFPSATAYHYKTYDADETETAPKTRRRAMILGAGPNRIGQGIEFDYCCVHASYALHEAGFETIMVNCNPETVSTDYDTSDKLYFEPLTFEDVMDIVDVEQPDGVVVTLGGQTPLKLANALAAAGVPIMGTSPEAIDLAEDRDRFAAVLDELGIVYPAAGMASTYQEACVVADRIGFPLLVRPSYVLGGRGMGIVYDGAQLEKYMAEAAKISPDHPVYLDRFLEGAVEVDLDALCDGEQVFVGGVLEHIEMAGIHSGDSACCTPPFALSEAVQAQLRAIARRLALRLGVVGLINIQFAIKDQVIYIIEANPRASRTVPFASKADGRSAGEGRRAHHGGGEAGRLRDAARRPPARAFQREGSRHALRPLPRRRHGARPRDEAPPARSWASRATSRRRSRRRSWPSATRCPRAARCSSAVCDRDKRAIVPIARDIARLGFRIVATGGTARTLRAAGVECEQVRKIHEGEGNVRDMIAAGDIALMINTPFGHATRADGYELRLEAVKHGVTHVTNLAGAQAMVAGMEAARLGGLAAVALQDLPQWELSR